MTERVTEFFKDLKERFSSPFFSAFVISWLFLNWKIPIALIFYKHQDVLRDGYKSFINLIEKNSSWWNNFWLPTLFALAYTFLFPVFRNVIQAFNAWVWGWGSAWNLRLARSGKISIPKYIRLRSIYEERTKLLEETLESESKFLEENERIINEKHTLLSQNNQLQAEISRWLKFNDVNFMNGDWIIRYPAELKSRNFYFNNGLIHQIIDSTRNKIFFGRITAMNGNPIVNKLTLVILIEKAPQNTNETVVHVLRSIDETQNFKGEENGRIEVIYERSPGYIDL